MSIISAKKNVTRSEYYEYIKKLNKVIPDSELRIIGAKFGTTRKDYTKVDICRIIPADWVLHPNLITMAKDNNILPEHAVKQCYKELKDKLGVINDNMEK